MNVDVVVPAKNAEKYLGNCLGFVRQQVYPIGNIYLFVIVDESEDETRRVAEKLIHRKGKALVSSKVLDGNGRYCAGARNVGLEAGNSKYVAFCDADDWWSIYKLLAQVEALERNPEIALAYTDHADYHPGMEQPFFYRTPNWNRKAWLNRRFIPWSSVVMRRSMIDHLRFDETLPQFDDLDFLIRLSYYHEFMRVGGTHTFRRFHPDTLTFRLKNEASKHREMIIGKRKAEGYL